MEQPREDDLLSIGPFARESGLSHKALRLYAELGLLAPAHVDRFTSYRYYDREQLGISAPHPAYAGDGDAVT